jgi:hypothetical protein
MEQETSNTISQSSFGPAWWDEFIRVTDDFSKPMVLAKVFERKLGDIYRSGILEVLRELAALRSQSFGYRVYVDGALLEADEMNDIYDQPPLDGESLPEWGGRVFGNRKFGIIINRGERFSQTLARHIALAFAPLFERTGYPQEGVNFTIFLGNYDKTPLGIHQDKRGESVMHFHLGPGEKTMHLWDPAEFESKLKSGEFKRADFDRLAPFSKTFRFGDGDVFFMPEGTYHIGKQNDFSVGLTVWRYNHADSMLLHNLHQDIFNRLAPYVGQQQRGDSSLPECTQALDPILGKLAITEDFKGLNYEELLREIYRDRRYEIHSNGGYRAAAQVGAKPITLSEEDHVVLEHPFRMHLKLPDGGTKMYLYVRGHKIELNRFDCLVSIVETLNEGRVQPVNALLRMLDPAWKKEIGLAFLSQIARHRGIRRLSKSEIRERDEPAWRFVEAVA